MAQLEVFKNPRGRGYPFLLDVQADLLQSLATRVVVPMTTVRRYGARPMTRLNPIARIGTTDYVLVFQELAAIPASALGVRVATLGTRRAEIIAALDLLFTGARAPAA